MLEIACFNTKSAVEAAEAGADRIELCSDYSAGGVTPLIGSLQDIRKKITTPINIMIRPRPGNFNYSDIEFHQMKEDIALFKSEASGFVFGILDEDLSIDKARNRELVQLAAPLPCTFHRAFDQTPDLALAAADLIECDFTSILTSGGKENAISGAFAVEALQTSFGEKISIILGGGVRSTNIGMLKKQTKVEWYHSAAITAPGETVNSNEVKKLQERLKDTA